MQHMQTQKCPESGCWRVIQDSCKERSEIDVKKSQQEQLFYNAYSNASARLSEPNSSINTDRASRIKNNDFFLQRSAP